MFNLLRRRPRGGVVIPPLSEMNPELAALIARPMPTTDQVRDSWHAEYLMALETIEQLTNLLAEASEVTSSARHLMTVMAMRTVDGEGCFLLNKPDDHASNLLRHAVLDLQARLEGSEVPSFTTCDRTKH